MQRITRPSGDAQNEKISQDDSHHIAAKTLRQPAPGCKENAQTFQKGKGRKMNLLENYIPFYIGPLWREKQLSRITNFESCNEGAFV